MKGWGILMEQQLQTLFDRIEEDIHSDSIDGFKNLLYLIYQNNLLGTESTLTEDITNFINKLFENGIVNPPNGAVKPSKENYCQPNGCKNPLTKDDIELDIQVMNHFDKLIPIGLHPTIIKTAQLRGHFDHKLDYF